jgi:hypothetical protein
MFVEQWNGIAYSYLVSVLGGRPDALLALEKSITEQTSKEINKSCINLPLLNDRYLACNSLIEKPQKALAERLPGKFQAGPWATYETNSDAGVPVNGCDNVHCGKHSQECCKQNRNRAEVTAAENAGREWSDGELNELGNMLVRGLSIEEIARRLRRENGEVRDKIVEIGRACR